VRLVIADTSPINYLILIGHIDILPSLFEKVILPFVVRDELTVASPSVRLWMADPPPWLEVRKTTNFHQLTVTGTLGVLGLAAQRGLLDLADAFDRLKRTNFRYRQETMDVVLKETAGKA